MAVVAETKCPQCGSTDLLWSEKRHRYVCEDCGHGFEPPVSERKLRIFLSYGHDDNEQLVILIKRDLEKRGHDVWIDKSEIKFGDDWRRQITDGILHSNRVLSFLSKYSTRDPGVCRDEIAIALGVKGGNIQTILVEGEQEVQTPVNISHVQWLDMHDWKDCQSAGDKEWETWYQAKLSKIVEVVESDESRRFAGEIETLSNHLKPIRSDARISQLLSKGFYGRQWLFGAVENWQNDATKDSRLFWIMGAPGVGKSAFAAQLTHQHGDRVIAAQFCEWDKPDHRSALRVVRSLAFQLATRLPDYRKLLLTLPEIAQLEGKNASELFDYLLANPLRTAIPGGRERYLIVIDALDEAGESGRNALVEMLARNAQRLPDWLGLVITSRPEFDVKTPLQALNPFPLDTESESNRADIRDYLHGELAAHLQELVDEDRIVEQILEKSEGVFLYAEKFCDEVRQGHIALNHPDQFPQGLGGIFADYFNRQFPDLDKFRKEIRPALRVILASREPLPVEVLVRLFNWQQEEFQDFDLAVGSLFPVTSYGTQEVIKPYHKSISDWLTSKAKAGAYFVDSQEGLRTLAEFSWAEYHRNVGQMSDFLVRYSIYFLRRVHRRSDAKELMRDGKFLRRRLDLGFGRIYICFSWHDNEIARLIGMNLEERGHTVLTNEDEGPSSDRWEDTVGKRIQAADLYVFLVSPEFMASKFAYDIEMSQALNQSRSETKVFPIILKHCDWMRSPLGQWQAYPQDCIPIEERDNGKELLDTFCEKLNVWFAESRQRHVFERLFGGPPK